MSILTSCPECDAVFSVKDQMAGKRIRCRKCQTPIRVEGGEPSLPCMPSSDLLTATELDTTSDTQDEVPILRRSSVELSEVPERISGGGTWDVWWLAYTARNPWVAITCFWCGFWLPFTYLESKFVLVMNIILSIACAAVGVVGMVLDSQKVTFDNPLDLINKHTVGNLITRYVSARLIRSIPGPRDANGARLAKQFGILAACFALHALLVWGLRWHFLSSQGLTSDVIQ